MTTYPFQYIYYVRDCHTEETVYVTEELDDAREWIDDNYDPFREYDISKAIDWSVSLRGFVVPEGTEDEMDTGSAEY